MAGTNVSQDWTTEVLERLSNHLLIIKYKGETRGSITLTSDEELRQWQDAVKQLNTATDERSRR